MKLICSLFIIFTLCSCSTVPTISTREPANTEGASCSEMAQNILMTETYKDDLNKVLAEKKLITLREKVILAKYPSLEWMSRLKTSLTNSLRNWNNQRYPAFYLFNDEEVIPTAKAYAKNIEKIVSDQVAQDEIDATKAYLTVSEWIKSFDNYQTEMDQLLEQRVSLQYNISLLKEIKLGPNETRDIQVSVKRGGQLQNEIITLRTEDKNLNYTIKKFKQEMSELDESFKGNGKIKERIIRQAMLKDMLTIVHRELEYVVKNTPTSSEEVLRTLDNLTLLLKKNENIPSTYGVYKITNKVFMRELASATKLDVAYQKTTGTFGNIRDVVTNYFAPNNAAEIPGATPEFVTGTTTASDTIAPAATEAEKTGFLQNIYAKISSIAPKNIVSGAVLVVGAIGVERYFAIKQNDVKEVGTGTSGNVATPEDQAHQAQLERTKQVDSKKQDGHSKVVEIQINDLQTQK